MNFYRINSSLDPDVIGNIPFGQAYTAEYPCAASDPALITNHLFERMDPGQMIVPTPILRPKAKLTDLISGIALGQSLQLMISDKLKTILEASGNNGIQFFPMDIIHRGKRMNGFWLAHPVTFDMEVIDYVASVVQVEGYGGMKLREVPVAHAAAFSMLKEATQYPECVRISKVKIDQKTEQPLVLLRDVWEGVGYYVSEVMKDRIEAAHCTGIVFCRPDERYPA